MAVSNCNLYFLDDFWTIYESFQYEKTNKSSVNFVTLASNLHIVIIMGKHFECYFFFIRCPSYRKLTITRVLFTLQAAAWNNSTELHSYQSHRLRTHEVRGLSLKRLTSIFPWIIKRIFLDLSFLVIWERF